MTQLSDPKNWNKTGGYKPGTSCLVTACFHRGLDIDCKEGSDFCGHRAQRLIRSIITNRWGDSRKDPNPYSKDGVIIEFNDHPMTTHEDIMWVLKWAEMVSRPIWRKPMNTATDQHLT